jgi:transcriptional regulator of arginine metabolism
MSKNYRQGQILKLVRSKEIYTQDELAQALKALGIVATQVTLSRDLRDLRLVKTQEGYQELAADETSRSSKPSPETSSATSAALRTSWSSKPTPATQAPSQ